MHIALVSHAFCFRNGQGRVNYEVARAALDVGMQVTVIAESCADDLVSHDRATFVNIRTSALPTRLLKNVSFAIRSALWIRRNRRNIDVIQASGFVTFASVDIVAAHFVHGAWLHSAYAPVKDRRGGFHTAYQRAYTRLNALLEQTAFRRARRVVAISDTVANELRLVGVADRRIAVIFNGVDIDEFRPMASDRAAFQLPDGVTLFLFSGDIRTHRKNLDGVLRAIAQVDSLHLAVAGGLEGSPYPALARELGIANRVHFLGHITQMGALMAAADAFIFPSRYDPMGLVVLEAMASGLPVVTARTTGAFIVLDDRRWTLDDPEDASGLVRMLRQLASDPPLRKRLGESNRAKALKHTWKSMASSYLDLYRLVGEEKLFGM